MMQTKIFNKISTSGISLLFLTLVVRVVVAYFCSAPNTDIQNYVHMVNAHNMGKLPYEFHAIYPYVPFSIPMPLFAMWLSDITTIPFHLTIKIYGIVGDAMVAWLLFKLKTLPRYIILGWVFNPLSIWITSMHGNIITCTPPLVLGAWYILCTIKSSTWNNTSAQVKLFSAFTLLGIGVAIRYWPVLLVPLFLFTLSLNLRNFILCCICVALPSLLSFIPLLFDPSTPWKIIQTEVFGYRSTPDLSWLGLLRAAWYSYGKSIWLPGSMTETGMAVGMKVFFVAYVTFLCVQHTIKEFSKKIVVPLLLYFSLAGGVAAQYLVLVVPFLLTWDNGKIAIIYSIIAWVSVSLFYIAWHPPIFWGAWSVPLIQPITNLQATIDQHILVQSQVIALYTLLVYTLVILVRAFRKDAWD